MFAEQYSKAKIGEKMFYIGGENVLDRGRNCSAVAPHFLARSSDKAGHYCPAVRMSFTSFTSCSISSNRSA